MTSSVSRYATRAVNIDKDVDIFNINKNTTPTEFNTRCNELGVVLEKGECFRNYTPLEIAFYRENMPLVDHIIKVGGKKLLDLGYEDGTTLLYRCTIDVDFPLGITLTKLGADVNIVIPTKGSLPEDTALWWLFLDMEITVLKASYITLKFLLRHGAIATPELTQRGKKIMEHAEKEMRGPLIAALSNAFSLTMPKELARITASYVPVEEIVINDEELEKEVAQIPSLWEETPHQRVEI
jgi:hypothetical protein